MDQPARSIITPCTTIEFVDSFTARLRASLRGDRQVTVQWSYSGHVTETIVYRIPDDSPYPERYIKKRASNASIILPEVTIQRGLGRDISSYQEVFKADDGQYGINNTTGVIAFIRYQQIADVFPNPVPGKEQSICVHAGKSVYFDFEGLHHVPTVRVNWAEEEQD